MSTLPLLDSSDLFETVFVNVLGSEARMTYSCCLDIPAREDAMFQVQLEGLGRMYPNIEGANPSIRHELLGPDKQQHDPAWFLDSASSRRRARIFVACPQGCAVCLGWSFEGDEIPKETEGWREMGPWLISNHIGQGKQGAVVCTGRWPFAGKGGVSAVKYPVEAEELELYARVHDIFGFPDLLDFGRVPGKKGEFYMAMSKIEPCLDILLRGQLHIHDNNPQTLGRISWPVVAGMGVQLLRALQAIHKRGVLACPESKVSKGFRCHNKSTRISRTPIMPPSLLA